MERENLPDRQGSLWPSTYEHLAEELILLSQHDGQNARGLRGVGRIARTVLKRKIVIIDLPEKLCSLDRHRAEVVLAVGIVFRREKSETAYKGKGLGGERFV
jgi:hypothetical protein